MLVAAGWEVLVVPVDGAVIGGAGDAEAAALAWDPAGKYFSRYLLSTPWSICAMHQSSS